MPTEEPPLLAWYLNVGGWLHTQVDFRGVLRVVR